MEKIKTHVLCSVTFFSDNCAVREISWKNIVELERPQMAIWHFRISRWVIKAADTHSEYVILIGFSTVKMIARTHLNVNVIRTLLVLLYFLTFNSTKLT